MGNKILNFRLYDTKVWSFVNGGIIIKNLKSDEVYKITIGFVGCLYKLSM
ncbi:hypothetical protein SAMN04489761_0509 [Tenacibaculum sp. MAR_2009_124]|nr:hypothetical protein SAMN04489761_0509 [Tenacibaculum sp. MAR_2009_124]